MTATDTETTTDSKKDWNELGEKVDLRTDLFIDGATMPSLSGERFDNRNPANGGILSKVSAGGSEDIDLAVAAARRSFESGAWSRTAPRQRKSVLARLAGLIEEHSDELALLDSLDMGKRIVEARNDDVPNSADVFAFYAEAIDKVYDEIAPTGPGTLATITREPLGVIGAITPWNFPLEIAAWKLAPALAAGNSVVLKPSEVSPSSALRLAELAIEAGLPHGVLNVVPGYGHTAGQALSLHHDVDCIAFTGSTGVGKEVLMAAGRSNLKQVWLECGGKSANVVFADVDIEAAASAACGAVFYNQGQVCSSNSRLLVDETIAEELIAAVLRHAEGYKPGDPLDPNSGNGSLASINQMNRVLDYVAEGTKNSRLLCGGEQVLVETGGAFVGPTVFSDVSSDSRLFREEIFGPVLAISTFSSEQEAINVANDTAYGLAASVWTRDLSRAHRVADALVAGTVSVNSCDQLSPQTPFGGFRQSGFGRDLSLHAIDKYMGLKTTWFSFD